jgi:hypothetical protein
MSLNIKPFDMKTIVINKDASGNSETPEEDG